MRPRADATSRDSRPTVVVYRNALLHTTETFIRAQVRALSRWNPVLVGERILPDGLGLDGLSTKLLLPESTSKPRLWLYRVYRYANFADPGVALGMRRLAPQLIHAYFGHLRRGDTVPVGLRSPLHGHPVNEHSTEWHRHPLNHFYLFYLPRMLPLLQISPCVGAVSKAVHQRLVEYDVEAKKVKDRAIRFLVSIG